jgi:hypothetical protein
MEKLVLDYFGIKYGDFCFFTFEYESLETAKAALEVEKKNRNQYLEFSFLGHKFDEDSKPKIHSWDEWFEIYKIKQ